MEDQQLGLPLGAPDAFQHDEQPRLPVEIETQAASSAATLAQRFLAVIEEDRQSDRGIRTKTTGSIFIRHYAERLEVSMYRLRKAIRDLVEPLEQELNSQGALHHPAEADLIQAIEDDVAANGRPVFGRAGRLDRRYYGKRIGVRTVGILCSHVFESYDEKYGAASNVETRITEMREWMEAQYAARMLCLRDGKIDRGAFQKEFDLRGGTFLVRYPLVRDLFREFDERARAENYQPAHVDSDLARLRDALDSGPPLNKDRLTVGRQALSKRLHISLGRIKNSPFVDEIRKFEEKLRHRAEQSDIDPYFAGRVFPFSDLSPSWGTPFLRHFGSQFKKSYGHARDGENVKPTYLALYDLLQWIGEGHRTSCLNVASSARTQQPIDGKEWELAVFAYRDHVVAQVKSGLNGKTNAHQTIALVRQSLPRLSPPLPAFETEIHGIKYARASTVHKPSLAEVSNPSTAVGSDYIEFAKSMLRQAADRYKVDLDLNEGDHFIGALASEMQRSHDLPTDPAHAVLLVLSRRLASIRDAAVGILEEARASIEHGVRLLEEADIDPTWFYDEYRSGRVAARSIVRDWFPDPAQEISSTKAEAAWRRSASNLLSLAMVHFDGLLPGNRNPKAAMEVGQFFQKRYLELGGFEKLEALLNPSRAVCGAALTLYLTESGANVSVGRTLPLDCVQPANEPGFKLVTGHKARAKGKPIYVELPSSSPAIAALDWYQQHSARYRDKVSGEDAKWLFVFRVGEKFQLSTPHWYTSWFKQFSSTLPPMQGVGAVPSMIRPSVLLKAALENDGRLQVGRAIGQHGQAVTRGYQEKLPIRLLRDEHMRRFQRHYETRVLQNVIDAARGLGISVEEFEQRVSELQATGLGTFCADPYARPGIEGQRCQSVDCWRDCPQLLVIANVESIALLQIWQNSLRDVQGDWERDHPERWGDVWLPCSRRRTCND
jgi:hypothetical protein